MPSDSNLTVNKSSDYLLDSNNPYLWIKQEDEKYHYLLSELISVYFASLNQSEKLLLLNNLVKVINFIYLKFDFYPDRGSALWQQLRENNLMDARALLAMMLPYILDDDSQETKKKSLTSLENLYLQKDSKGRFYYTNNQYNRCLRQLKGNDISVIERPYLKEYFIQHMELILSSIEASSHKLYINWVNILPITITEYQDSSLYRLTRRKMVEEIPNQIALINGYLDPLPGLSLGDLYNTIVNQLYYEIKNIKWLIYDIMVQDKPILYIRYLESRIDLSPIWGSLTWSQLTDTERSLFSTKWNDFFHSDNANDQTILHTMYFFLSKYYRDRIRLINDGKLKLIGIPRDDKDVEETTLVSTEKIQDVHQGMRLIPVADIYAFLWDQITNLKKTWYYYQMNIKKNDYLLEENDIRVTLKNVYNYAESMGHYFSPDQKFTPLPRYWTSLLPELIEQVIHRIYDIYHPVYNNWRSRLRWFNINNYLRRLYPDSQDLNQINRLVHQHLRTKIVDIVFESLIYHGLLSKMVPKIEISSIRSRPEQYQQLKVSNLTDDMIRNYENHSFYFLTGTNYGLVDSGKFLKEIATLKHRWIFTYPLNWISQLNFYHHYLHNRVIYVTGATGVGKSTQTPKLLLYCQKMLDFNVHGKIVCTQPRIEPVVSNADTISKELGVPIFIDNLPTSNYQVQYRHSKSRHVSNIDYYLRLVTDGTLFEQLKMYPFLSRSEENDKAYDIDDNKISWAKIYGPGNLYDVVMVDEAHEHNTNMDMILTLMRDAAYVNNSLKLVILSATLEDDEPIYRRYYRIINDNLAYPLSAYIEANNLDRANMDRRIHISAPGTTTVYQIRDHYATPEESAQVNVSNYVHHGIEKTIQVINQTQDGDLLLFLAGQADIEEAVHKINSRTPAHVICFGFYGDLPEEMRKFIINIHETLKTYTRYKEDINLPEEEVDRRVAPGTYQRAVIIATNVAEASITLERLKYVVDSGYAKVNIYDPIEGISKLITLPISWTSSIQRRGRVGRVSDGDVYYLYSKEKIINNKTSYKIADSDPKDIIIKLIKSEAIDSPIIMRDNDYSHIQHLKELRSLKEIGRDADATTILYRILGNPYVYLEIIRKQYLYSPDLSDILNYYTYYGKTSPSETIDAQKSNLRSYLINNHDDYHYQEQYFYFISRGHTGYDSFRLEDRLLDFYLIHPDENVIERDPFTGRMRNLRCSDSVPPSYYYYLLYINQAIGPDFLGCDNKAVERAREKILSQNFSLEKYWLAIDDAKLQMLVVELPLRDIKSLRLTIKGLDPDQQARIDRYYRSVDAFYLYGQGWVVIRSTFFSDLERLSNILSIKELRNVNNLLWYVFSLPHQLGLDVIALIQMIEVTWVVSGWLPSAGKKKPPPEEVERFFRIHQNNQGDIFFLWKLWSRLKEMFRKNDLFRLTEVDGDWYDTFLHQKNQFLRGEIKNPQILSIFQNLNKMGKLNIEHEFYFYFYHVTIDFSVIFKQVRLEDYLNIIAEDYFVSKVALMEFTKNYFNTLFSLNKTTWLQQYEIEHHLPQEEHYDGVMTFWAHQKSLFKPIDSWTRILETYLRAFSTNLLKNEATHYLRMNKGTRIHPKNISKKIEIENTLLHTKMDYIVYHHSDFIKDQSVVSYLTPVKLEWVLNLNPIYYYHFLFDKNNIIYQIKDDPDVARTRQLILQNRSAYSLDQLISYIDQLNNPSISRQLRALIEHSRQSDRDFQ